MPRSPQHKPLLGRQDALQFVVKFVQMDLARINPTQLKDVEQRVRQLIAMTVDPPDIHDWASDGWRGEPPVRKAVLLRLHADAKSWFTGIVMSGHARVELRLKFSTAWAPSQRPSRQGRARSVPVWIVVNGSPRDRFLYRVIRLVNELGVGKLRACPEYDKGKCDRFFVKVTRKEFCSARCQSRAYMREHRL